MGDVQEDGRARVPHALLSPVRRIATDPDVDAPAEGIGLCLSGGGYRAMLFHAGSLWRLNEAGYLPKLSRVSSVSGGSIIAGTLASRWPRLAFSGDVAGNFVDEIVRPVRTLASKTLDVPAVAYGLLIPGSTINERLASSYRRILFDGSPTLQDLPDAPDFIINATSLQTGDLWRFGKREQGDWRAGEMASPTTDLARAVAASSAFPPVLSPAVFEFSDGAMSGGSDPAVACDPYTRRAVLADGGVYDNLGLEAVWKKCKTVLVSDGGGHMADAPKPRRMWVFQFPRVLVTIDNQVRDLRKQQAVSSYVTGQRDGSYWGIRSHVRDFGLDDPLLDPPDEVVMRLAKLPTRLRRVDATTQERLINWGYLICDTALRRWVAREQPKGSFPYPSAGLGGG